MQVLLKDWQQFWCENSEIWGARFDYREAGPQLLMQAFLQRVINGGGRIDREYGLGRRQTDLLITYPIHPVRQWIVIELKVAKRGLAQVLMDGLKQTRDYMDQCGADEGHLILFDLTPGRSWEERIYSREEESVPATGHLTGHSITVWGC